MGKTPDDSGFKFEWLDEVSQCRLGAATKSVAAWLCRHANTYGRGAHPGVRRLAYETELGESTVRRSLEQLRELGLIVRVVRGSVASNRNYADKYNLVLPADLQSRVTVQPKPATQRSGHGRGGKANHVRWHEQRGKFDADCVHCAESQETLARTSGGPQETLTKISPPIRPPLGRISDQRSDGRDHRSVEEHQQGYTTKDISHHPDRPRSGPRTSSRARDESKFNDFAAARWQELVDPWEKLTDDEADEVLRDIKKLWVEQVVTDLDEMEQSTVDGMLYNAHACTIVNTILADRYGRPAA